MATTRKISATDRSKDLLIALPEPGRRFTQDREWCVVRLNDDWRQIRFHDYDELYSIPGLYEKVIYDVLQCESPKTVCGLLAKELRAEGDSPDALRVLDLGAGNGMVGEELAGLGANYIVGVDIIDEAAKAARRDRPDVYDHYHVADLTDLTEDEEAALQGHRFNCMTCVAALGFGDIPADAFTTAFNLVDDGGWIAFNIKEDFLEHSEKSEFATLIRGMKDRGTLNLLARHRYVHRLGTDRQPLYYVAVVGRKCRDV